ncbi:FRG domain-containing protein [Fodinibius salsisoli]|uniref:FRG domain-containing protein n=1 Tax=Fodinibius salsisoli TaxID=2820877 RepID=A0ABT3PKA9_9BACT|nr:FRG domain-containing protein [Fodinibius salsisoli]MCW9706386.1 FRG domain-containing protein [Fodinibius salsisoli]
MEWDFTSKTIESWSDLDNLDIDQELYLFRGQSKYCWDLETTIERAFHRNSVDRTFYINHEHWMLYEFKRRAHLYLSYEPDQDDLISWFAQMQHFGAPTRLLDFTHSLYIASYFALINGNDNAAIWGIREPWIRNSSIKYASKFQDKLNFSELDFEDLSSYGLRDDQIRYSNNFGNSYIKQIHKDHKPGQVDTDGSCLNGLLMVEPNKQIERLAKQQGVFLMPLDIRKTFQENLVNQFLNTYSAESNKRVKNVVIKILIKKEARDEILEKLKEINITAELLFPGIEGFAKSLEHLVMVRSRET